MKVFGYILMGIMLVFAQGFYNEVYMEIETSLAMEQFADPSAGTDVASRTIDRMDPFPLLWIGYILFGCFVFRKEVKERISKMRKSLLVMVGLACLSFTGCWRPYHERMLVDVQTSEVAFLVETVNDNGQASIAPKGKGDNIKEDGTRLDFYKDRMVNARKIEVPYYWKQTHRAILPPWDSSMNGEWRPAARLLVVDTQPETREWSKETDKPIWVESQDSVGFSTGISITARIEDQDDAVKFLSNYPPKEKRTVEASGGEDFNVEVSAIKQIMDEEVRTKIQEVFAYEAANYTMDELREKKRDIMDSIREEVIPYFEERGITITTIGQFGGFEYENKNIQDAIDEVFTAQQDEEVAKAEAKAAEQRKEALRLKGEGEAAQILASKEGEAEGVKLVADAKKYEIEQLQADPEAYLQLRQLENQQSALEKWDGTLPKFMIGKGGGVGAMILDMKEVSSSKKQDQVSITPVEPKK